MRRSILYIITLSSIIVGMIQCSIQSMAFAEDVREVGKDRAIFKIYRGKFPALCSSIPTHFSPDGTYLLSYRYLVDQVEGVGKFHDGLYLTSRACWKKSGESPACTTFLFELNGLAPIAYSKDGTRMLVASTLDRLISFDPRPEGAISDDFRIWSAPRGTATSLAANQLSSDPSVEGEIGHINKALDAFRPYRSQFRPLAINAFEPTAPVLAERLTDQELVLLTPKQTALGGWYRPFLRGADYRSARGALVITGRGTHLRLQGNKLATIATTPFSTPLIAGANGRKFGEISYKNIQLAASPESSDWRKAFVALNLPPDAKGRISLPYRPLGLAVFDPQNIVASFQQPDGYLNVRGILNGVPFEKRCAATGDSWNDERFKQDADLVPDALPGSAVVASLRFMMKQHRSSLSYRDGDTIYFPGGPGGPIDMDFADAADQVLLEDGAAIIIPSMPGQLGEGLRTATALRTYGLDSFNIGTERAHKALHRIGARKNLTLMATSYGAPWAIAFLNRYPELVDDVILFVPLTELIDPIGYYRTAKGAEFGRSNLRAFFGHAPPSQGSTLFNAKLKSEFLKASRFGSKITLVIGTKDDRTPESTIPREFLASVRQVVRVDNGHDFTPASKESVAVVRALKVRRDKERRLREKVEQR